MQKVKRNANNSLNMKISFTLWFWMWEMSLKYLNDKHFHFPKHKNDNKHVFSVQPKQKNCDIYLTMEVKWFPKNQYDSTLMKTT